MCKRDDLYDVPIANSPVAEQCCPLLAYAGESAFSSLEWDRRGKMPRNLGSGLEMGLVQEANFPPRKSGLSPSQQLEESGWQREHQTVRNSCKWTEMIKQSSTMT